MSGKKEYVKLWLSYETYFQSYTPEEIGNLVLAMLHYKDTGETPVFQGSERFIWPAVQRDIDEARSAQEAAAGQSRENGRKGGRPRREPQDIPAAENRPGFSQTRKTTWSKDKDMEKGHCHCQGQGHTGEGRQGAAPGRRTAARKKGGLIGGDPQGLRAQRALSPPAPDGDGGEGGGRGRDAAPRYAPVNS